MEKNKILGTQLIARACGLLKLFSSMKPEMSLVELAELSGLHTATAYRILQALVLEGLLMQDPNTGKYRLGLGLLRLGELSKNGNSLYRISYPWVEKLAKKWGETVILDAMMPKFEVVRLMVFSSSYRIASNFDHHKFRPPHCIAAGKQLLAYVSPQELNQYLSTSLESFTDYTITDHRKLIEELAKIRKQGFATNFEEQEINFNAVAAPVKNAHGSVVAALSLGGPSSRLNQSTIAPIINSVVETANNISSDLGYIKKKDDEVHIEFTKNISLEDVP